jgi:hypothetical protein
MPQLFVTQQYLSRYYGSSTICCLCVLRGIISGCISEGLEARRHYTHFRCNPRICRTCVRILEELLIVINSCVLNFEWNKLPSWIENVTICKCLVVVHVKYFLYLWLYTSNKLVVRFYFSNTDYNKRFTLMHSKTVTYFEVKSLSCVPVGDLYTVIDVKICTGTRLLTHPWRYTEVGLHVLIHNVAKHVLNILHVLHVGLAGRRIMLHAFKSIFFNVC